MAAPYLCCRARLRSRRVFSSCAHAAAGVGTSFLLGARNGPLYVRPQFSLSTVICRGRLGGFRAGSHPFGIPGITPSTDTGVHVCSGPRFRCSGATPRSRGAGSHDRATFHFSRSFHTALRSGHTVSRSRRRCGKARFPASYSVGFGSGPPGGRRCAVVVWACLVVSDGACGEDLVWPRCHSPLRCPSRESLVFGFPLCSAPPAGLLSRLTGSCPAFPGPFRYFPASSDGEDPRTYRLVRTITFCE